MQAQSRFAVSSSSSSVSAAEHEAVIRELARGRELTAQLQAEALRALRGKGEAEGIAAGILQEVSSAFAFCLSIMSSPARAAPGTPETPEQGRRTSGNGPRREVLTYTPYDDGYQWRKYGQKKITNKIFPRCYFRCSQNRERGCPATKLVQKHRHGDPPQYAVIYINEHTCDTPAWEPEAANPLPDLPGLQGGGGLLGERGVQEEHERQALVSSLACVLGAPQSSPAAAGGALLGQQGRTRDAPAPASASVPVDPMAAAAGELPRLHVGAEGLDIMDYDMTGELLFGGSSSSYGGLPDDDGSPF